MCLGIVVWTGTVLTDRDGVRRRACELNSRMETTEVPSKLCTKCGEVKPLVDFPVNRARPDGHLSGCKVCHSAYGRLTYRAPASHRANYLKRSYGITDEKFQSMLAAQGGTCAFLNCPETLDLQVDHDHACCDVGKNMKTCGKCVRSILCRYHNRLLGQARDSRVELLKAFMYLGQWADVTARLECGYGSRMDAGRT